MANMTTNSAGPIPVYLHKHATSTAAIIVMQEWWGVTEQIKKQALDWFAQEYTVAVPDFYRGKASLDREEAGHLRQGLDWVG
jgi:carboxymethylenebutenolidase